MSKPDPTRNTRAAKYRAASKTAGGVRVDVQIGPEAAAALARMRSSRMTVREAVEAALLIFDQWSASMQSVLDNGFPPFPVNPPAPAAPPTSTSAPAD